MHRFATALFSLVVMLLAQSSLSAQGKGPKEAKFGWLPSLQEGKLQASKSGKPIMAVLRCVP